MADDRKKRGGADRTRGRPEPFNWPPPV